MCIDIQMTVGKIEKWIGYNLNRQLDEAPSDIWHLVIENDNEYMLP